MMLFKVLVIAGLCALTVTFPTEPITDDPLDVPSEELPNSAADIEGLMDSVINLIKSIRKLPPPIEKVITKIRKVYTDSDSTMDFNPTSDFLSNTEVYHENTQISDLNLTFAGTLDPQ